MFGGSQASTSAARALIVLAIIAGCGRKHAEHTGGGKNHGSGGAGTGGTHTTPGGDGDAPGGEGGVGEDSDDAGAGGSGGTHVTGPAGGNSGNGGTTVTLPDAGEGGSESGAGGESGAGEAGARGTTSASGAGGEAGSGETGPSWPPLPPDSRSEVVSYQIDTAHTGAQLGDTLTLPLARRWRHDFGTNHISYPLVARGLVFVTIGVAGAQGANLYALDEATGETRWGPVALGGRYQRANAAYEDGRLFTVNVDGVMRAFDAATGEGLWSVQLPDKSLFSGPPVARGRRCSWPARASAARCSVCRASRATFCGRSR